MTFCLNDRQTSWSSHRHPIVPTSSAFRKKEQNVSENKKNEQKSKQNVKKGNTLRNQTVLRSWRCSRSSLRTWKTPKPTDHTRASDLGMKSFQICIQISFYWGKKDELNVSWQMRLVNPSLLTKAWFPWWHHRWCVSSSQNACFPYMSSVSFSFLIQQVLLIFFPAGCDITKYQSAWRRQTVQDELNWRSFSQTTSSLSGWELPYSRKSFIKRRTFLCFALNKLIFNKNRSYL